MGSKKYAISAGVLLTILCVILPMDAFYSGDSGVKLIQVENLISKGWKDVSLDYNGSDIDPTSEVSPFQLKPNCFIQNGKNYSVFPVLFPFLSSIIYLIIGYPGLYILPLVSAFGILLVVYRLSKRYLPASEADTATFLTMFTTPLLFYSLTFSEHVPATFLVLLSILMFLEGNRSRWWGGIFLGISVWFRSEIIILIPLLLISGLYYYKHRRKIVLYSVTSLVPVIMLLAFNKIFYGEWLGHVMRNLKISSDKSISSLLAERSTNLWRSIVGLNKPQLLSPSKAGWNNSLAIIRSSTALEVLCFICILSLFFYAVYLAVKKRKDKGKKSQKDYSAIPIILLSGVLFLTVTYYLISCLSDRSPLITVLRSGGIFSFSPYLSLALLLPIVKHKCESKTREIQWILLSSILFMIITSFAAPNDGGIRYGARYILPIVPLLSVASFIVYYSFNNHRMKRILRAVSIALIISSIFVQIRGFQILYHKKNINSRITRILLDSPSERVAMQAWWMIFNAAPVTVSKKTHILRDTRFLSGMIQESRRVGDKYMTIVLTKTDTITKDHRLGKFFQSQKVEIYRQEQVINSFDTFFNYTVITLKL